MKAKKLLVLGVGCVCAGHIVHANQTVTYSYDALGRLIKTQSQGGTGSGTTQNFQYDPAGNRKQYQSLLQVSLSMNSPVVNLTASGAKLTVNLSNSSATGTVTFTDDATGAILGGIPVSVSNGQATVTVQGLSKGTHTITASYSGDGADTSQVTTFTINVQYLGWLPAVLQLLLQN